MAAFRAAYSSLETVGSVGWKAVDCGADGALGAGFCGKLVVIVVCPELTRSSVSVTQEDGGGGMMIWAGS